MSENNIYPELSGGLVCTRLEDAMDREFIKPQINADERRFVNLNIQRFSEVYQMNIQNRRMTVNFRFRKNINGKVWYQKKALTWNPIIQNFSVN